MMQEYKITMGQKRAKKEPVPNLPNWQMDDFGTDPRQKRNRPQTEKNKKKLREKVFICRIKCSKIKIG